MKKKKNKIFPYIAAALTGSCLIIATAWVGLLISDHRVVELPYTESTRNTQVIGGYQIKSEVSNFTLKNVNGEEISLGNYASEKGVIIIFTCNHCPFAKAYEDRIRVLDAKFRPAGFPVIAINPTDPSVYEEDSFSKMKQRAQSKGYSFPYLVDDTQKTAKKFGATKTPHLFILSNDNGKFIVEYIGAIDDNPQDPSGVKRHYAEEAVNNLLSGKPVATSLTKAIGCVIKWKDL